MELIPEAGFNRSMSIGGNGIANANAVETSEVEIVNPWLSMELQRLFGDTQQ